MLDRQPPGAFLLLVSEQMFGETLSLAPDTTKITNRLQNHIPGEKNKYIDGVDCNLAYNLDIKKGEMLLTSPLGAHISLRGQSKIGSSSRRSPKAVAKVINVAKLGLFCPDSIRQIVDVFSPVWRAKSLSVMP